MFTTSKDRNTRNKKVISFPLNSPQNQQYPCRKTTRRRKFCLLDLAQVHDNPDRETKKVLNFFFLEFSSNYQHPDRKRKRKTWCFLDVLDFIKDSVIHPDDKNVLH